MIVEKRSPALARWPSRLRHVLCHRGLADIDPELEQFTMDTGRTPERVKPTIDGQHDLPAQFQ